MATEKLKAVFLAAGLGTRLMPLTHNLPKALVPVGETTLLERLTMQCELVGIEEVIVVTGYCAEKVEEWKANRSGPATIHTVHNPEFDVINNAHSLWIAHHFIGASSFIKFDGDLMLHTDILRKLVDSPFKNAVVYDNSAPLADEEMKLQFNAEGRVTALGKWLEPGNCQGEAMGIEKIHADDAQNLFATIKTMVRDEGNVDAYYEDAYHRMIPNGFEMYGVSTEGLACTEVDTPDDLARAEQILASFSD